MTQSGSACPMDALISVLARRLCSFHDPLPLVLQSLQARMRQLSSALERSDDRRCTTIWRELLAFRFHPQMQQERFREIREAIRDFDKQALEAYDRFAEPVIRALKDI